MSPATREYLLGELKLSRRIWLAALDHPIWWRRWGARVLVANWLHGGLWVAAWWLYAFAELV